MKMLDADHDGKVDEIDVLFTVTVLCTATCTNGWSVSNIPSGGTLSSVTVSSKTAKLMIAEGAGAADTSVGTLTVALAAPGGITDSAGRYASFASTIPTDAASPVPTFISSTNKSGGTAGKAEAGDTVTVTFSEPLAALGVATSTVTLSTTSGAGTAVKLNLTGLASAAFQIGVKNNYLSGATATSAVFGPTASTLALSGSQVTATLGTWAGAGTLSSGSYVAGQTAPFIPAATIKDPAGNAAAGTLPLTVGLF